MSAKKDSEQSVFSRLGLTAITLILVALFRVPGAAMASVLCFIALRGDWYRKPNSKLNSHFWVIGQFVIGVVAYLVAIPFNDSLINSPIIQYMADFPIIKMPLDRLILGLTMQPEQYSDAVEMSKKRGVIANAFLSYYGALYISAIVALIWFSIALPKQSRMRNEKELDQKSVQKYTVKHRLISSFILLILISLAGYFNFMFFGTRKTSEMGVLLSPHWLLCGILELFRYHFSYIRERINQGLEE